MQIILCFFVCNVLATKKKKEKKEIATSYYPTSVGIISLKPHTLLQLEAILL